MSKARGLLLAGALLGLGACDYLPAGFTPIADILGQPAAFEGREVKVSGKVVDVNKIPFLNIELYTLRDESGEIVVTRPAELPRVGEALAVRGRVESLAILGGEGFGTALRETGRLPSLPSWPASNP